MPETTLNLSQAEQQVKDSIVSLVQAALGTPFDPSLISVEYPPDAKLGDYSVACFSLAKSLHRQPAELAAKLTKSLKPAGLIAKASAAGPYLNFSVDLPAFSQLVVTEIAKRKRAYGTAKIGRGKRVMVEYFSPNTNKPLTVGHLRNICLGASLARLLKFLGYKVIESTLYNDRGIAIAKTIVGYQKWGDRQTPKSAGLKPDHFVGNFYTRFSQEAAAQPKLDKEAQRALQAWEKGDKTITAVWQKLMRWVLEGFRQTLKKLGVGPFDQEYYESEFYRHGKEVVEAGLRQGVFVRNPDGVVVAPLAQDGLPDKIVLRPDDTSLYVTQDLYLATLKEKSQPDQSIYVVGNEQDLYFKQLFKILERLGQGDAGRYYHLSYAMVRLPSGKIKSRQGLVKGTGADELVAQLEEMASQEVMKRNPALSATEAAKRAEDIAIGALKFYLVAVDPKKTMIFDPEQSLQFNGRTGPYLQYVHARIASLFTKANVKPSLRVDWLVVSHPLERELLRLLARFPSAVQSAATGHNPSLLANYLFELAKTFSLFYEALPVLKAPDKVKRARLLLLRSVQTVLASGLQLLGITAVEQM
ncbi:MAG: arginine--tRNA ligase [Candidatus Buchananbacteria bacterium RIFCSPHIGHO2_02_FULL_56_16]|uniref:Arginine--tRNA ligase n=1 Tax=Candidatus Buchananbacteria bacterium RIFCSPHIGHO2_02_FULL_56_16 TaxID=1797542 RepID=A0A1G1YFC1_9BACT|nr:MAG: arginine--tRNA ligase [Candidatus Buchananbacteria bacterium RIFCSPHIGHO2_02_FULL_56_16]